MAKHKKFFDKELSEEDELLEDDELLEEDLPEEEDEDEDEELLEDEGLLEDKLPEEDEELSPLMDIAEEKALEEEDPPIDGEEEEFPEEEISDVSGDSPLANVVARKNAEAEIPNSEFTGQPDQMNMKGQVQGRKNVAGLRSERLRRLEKLMMQVDEELHNDNEETFDEVAQAV